MRVELIGFNCMTPEIIGQIAGNTIKKNIKSDKKCIEIYKKAISMGHTSILEHAVFTFHITGLNKSASHQLVRHRIASYTQTSDRRKTADQFSESLEPLRHGKIYEEAKDVIDKYIDMLEMMRFKGIPLDDLKKFVPTGSLTDLYMTINARSLRNLVVQRYCLHSEDTIRELAGCLIRLVSNIDKLFFYALDIEAPCRFSKCPSCPIKTALK